MPTKKSRINITMPKEMDKVIQRLAKRDETSLAAKTLELVRQALEIEEDIILLHVGEDREKSARTSSYLTHEQVWD